MTKRHRRHTPPGTPDDHMTLVALDRDLHPPSEACVAYMVAQGYDPWMMPVCRAEVSPELMMKMKAERPDVGNIVHLLVGPFGLVAPPGGPVLRVAQLQVGDNLLDVEAEYQP